MLTLKTDNCLMEVATYTGLSVVVHFAYCDCISKKNLFIRVGNSLTVNLITVNPINVKLCQHAHKNTTGTSRDWEGRGWEGVHRGEGLSCF